MNCERKYGKFDVKNLTPGQQVVFKPALSFLQIGASFYLSELLKPVLLPVLLISIAVVLVVVLKSKKQSLDYAEIPTEQVVVCLQTENNSFKRPVELTRN
ncbi:MAG: hypothetical protein JST44_23120 [Cyanobacteria bacterium SZAS LIN-5]|nr:hypothetical protein [Cyanobacteria bacterium SZAS LIN-5]RTL43739.1 MAG: hypothetical protein EKK48_08310 [Candidatus Melainabacteria bacterium]